MTGRANVQSIEAIRDFRIALIKFEEEASAAVDSLQQEIIRSLEWVEHDRPFFWKSQVRRGFDQISRTRTALETCKMRSVAGRRPACIEEQLALKKAKQRLQTAQEMVKFVQQWSGKLRHEVDDYNGQVGKLKTCLQTNVPRMIALLERSLNALDSYATIPTVENKPKSGTGTTSNKAETSKPEELSPEAEMSQEVVSQEAVSEDTEEELE